MSCQNMPCICRGVLVLDGKMDSHVVEVGLFLDGAPLGFLRRRLFLEPIVELLLQTKVVKAVKFYELSFVGVYVH